MSERAPAGLKAGGRRLWRGVTAHVDLDEHERALLLEACRTRDHLDELEAIVVQEGRVLRGAKGGRIPHPALVEARQQRIALTRLIASLRLPDDLAHPTARPQRRGAARGAYQPRGGLRAVR